MAGTLRVILSVPFSPVPQSLPLQGSEMVERIRSHHQTRCVFGQNHTGSHVQDEREAGDQAAAGAGDGGREGKGRMEGCQGCVRCREGGRT